jgi:hypothetical protein
MEGSDRCPVDVLSPNFIGRTKESHRNLSQCIWAEIRTKHLPNPSLERYRWQASTMRWWSASSLSKGAAYTKHFRRAQRIQIWRAWRPCSGSSSTNLSVMINVTENTSHSTAKMCRSTIIHYFSYNSQIKCFRKHVDMDMFSCLSMWNSFPNLVRAFQLHSVHKLKGASYLTFCLHCFVPLEPVVHWMLRRCPTTLCCLFKMITMVSFLPLLLSTHKWYAFHWRVKHTH